MPGDPSALFTLPTLLILAGLSYSVVLHAAAHAFAADRLGDPTPRALGKVTLNPVPIIRTSPLFTLALPIITWFTYGGRFALGGGATPVDGNYFRVRPKADLLMSIVGPLTNLTLCVLLSLILCIPHLAPKENPLFLVFFTLAWTNLILAVFNLLPIPPMDGAHVFGALFPSLRRLYESVEEYGFMLVILIGWPLFWHIAPPLGAKYIQVVGRLYELANGPGTWPGDPFKPLG